MEQAKISMRDGGKYVVVVLMRACPDGTHEGLAVNSKGEEVTVGYASGRGLTVNGSY